MKKKHYRQNLHLALCVIFILAALSINGCTVSPQPFTSAELKEKAESGITRIFADQEPLKAEITLYDAMARAIKYNLNHKVKLLEKAQAKGGLLQSQKDLLPQLVSSAGYTSRNNHNSSFSENLYTGIKTTDADLSMSENKQNFTSDLLFVWNVLDFGVGYNQAKQQADNVLIAEEHRRKAAQNISQELRYAFWKALSAEKLLPKMDSLLKEAESALAKSRQMEKKQAGKPFKILDYQQELLETVQQLWGMRRSLSLAKTELSTLMNLKPGTDFKLKTPDHNTLQYPDFSLELLEEYALQKRPELITEVYLERIGALEVKKAMLRMLPGLELNAGINHDSNSYLYNNSWLTAGLNLSWNAFSLLSAPTAIKNAEMQRDLAKQRYMAASMMVLSQVNIAKQQYHLSLKDYNISSQLAEIQERKLWHSEAAKKAKTGTELEDIRSNVNALSAEMQQGLSFSELQSAIGNIYNSIGIDPLPETISSSEVSSLANIIKGHDEKVLKYFSANARGKYSVANPFSPTKASKITIVSNNKFVEQPIDESVNLLQSNSFPLKTAKAEIQQEIIDPLSELLSDMPIIYSDPAKIKTPPAPPIKQNSHDRSKVFKKYRLTDSKARHEKLDYIAQPPAQYKLTKLSKRKKNSSSTFRKVPSGSDDGKAPEGRVIVNLKGYIIDPQIYLQ